MQSAQEGVKVVGHTHWLHLPFMLEAELTPGP